MDHGEEKVVKRLQVVLNITTLEVTQVDWGDYPPLFTTPDQVDIMQFVFWSDTLGQWVKMVHQHTGTPGAVELTLHDFMKIGQQMKSGLPLPAAVAALTGSRQ